MNHTWTRISRAGPWFRSSTSRSSLKGNVWASVLFGTYQVAGSSRMGWTTHLSGEPKKVLSSQTPEPDWPMGAAREFIKILLYRIWVTLNILVQSLSN